ncbi:SMP-30/gluconolactonase/LRE family protein [Methylobacterium terricola]|uniref:SMP-30/gluconolactonase/LRE family protein n=1 Tax=Methylobacterium terricola TaxID=2583531 RepID=A0A5C4LI40_9HYPH|nr:SMP-30/gluconolactonase/LRE family protein [Methylobacterium terricola]TNC13013.1 SMP-30/gluconolactonase/LRE family protein [Methylobacterium terricola]
MKRLLRLAFPVAMVLLGAAGLHAQESGGSELRYGPTNSGPVPIPPAERGLATVVAEPWFKVSDQGLQLEGPSFDRDNNLIFLEVFGGRVFKLTPEKTLSTIVPPNKLAPAGIAIHKDGRLFVAGLGNFKDTGSVIAVNSDGSGQETIIPASAGYLVDDLVFDSKGGFYFTDFRGSTSEPTGGVYYVSPDFKVVTPILKNMAVANGISLSPNGKELWVTELSRGLLHRVELEDPTTIAPYGTAIAYHFTGPAPDSMRADSDGNLYVAMYMQGRVLVFNRSGIPIGQILIPGRDEGHNLRTTSLAIRPGTNDLYIVTNDAAGGMGATIFHAKGFAKALPLYSHR